MRLRFELAMLAESSGETARPVPDTSESMDSLDTSESVDEAASLSGSDPLDDSDSDAREDVDEDSGFDTVSDFAEAVVDDARDALRPCEGNQSSSSASCVASRCSRSCRTNFCSIRAC